MNKSKLKNSSYKTIIFIVIVIALILSIIISIVSWYRNEHPSKTNSVDISIKGNNLSLSVDAYNWNDKISKKDLLDARINYSNNINQLPDSLSAVSTAGGVQNGKMDMFYITPTDITKDNYNIMASKETETYCLGDDCKDKHFIAFDIFVKTEESKALYLSKKSNVTAQIESSESELVNALRVGFVIEGMIPYNSSKERAQKLTGGTYAIIWEPNYDIHSSNGLENAKNIYEMNLDNDNNSSLEYQGISSPFNDKISIKDIKNSSYFTTVNPTIKTKKEIESSEKIIDLSAGISKFRIYIWLESQDIDMIVNKKTSNIKINIELDTTK